MTETASPAWYVIYTRPRHEKKVAEQLDNLELPYFLPITRTLKMWAKRKKYMSLPLFPSYVFVKPQTAQQYVESLQIPGVLYYVKIGNKIAEISEKLIHKIKSVLSGDSDHSVEVSAELIKPGTVHHILSGPFAGLDCEVVEHKGKNKLLVRIELLQRTVMVDLPLESFADNLSYN